MNQTAKQATTMPEDEASVMPSIAGSSGETKFAARRTMTTFGPRVQRHNQQRKDKRSQQLVHEAPCARHGESSNRRDMQLSSISRITVCRNSTSFWANLVGTTGRSHRTRASLLLAQVSEHLEIRVGLAPRSCPTGYNKNYGLFAPLGRAVPVTRGSRAMYEPIIAERPEVTAWLRADGAQISSLSDRAAGDRRPLVGAPSRRQVARPRGEPDGAPAANTRAGTTPRRRVRGSKASIGYRRTRTLPIRLP